MVALSSLSFSLSLAAAVLAHRDVHQQQKRAIQVVTVTDIVWEYVTVTRVGPKPTTFAIMPSVTPAAAAAAATPSAAVNGANAAPVAVSVPPPAAAVAVASDPLVEAAVNAPAEQVPVVQDAPAVVAASDAQVPPPAAVSVPDPIAAAPVAAAPVAAAPVVDAPVAVAPTPAPAAVDTTQQSSSTSSGSGTFSGDATFYSLGLTACGQTYTDNDFVAAISFPLFNKDSPANPNLAPSCGKQIKVMRGSKSTVVQIRDKCEGCKLNDIDLSPAAFRELGDESEGRFPITWEYL